MGKFSYFIFVTLYFLLFTGGELKEDTALSTLETLSYRYERAPKGRDLIKASTSFFQLSANIALVVGNTQPSSGSGDALIKSKLEVLGHNVTYVSHNTISLSTFDTSYDLAIISESVRAATIGIQLNNWTKPIAIFERGLIDDFKLGSGQAELNVNQINITNSASLLGGGYANGNQSLSGIVAYTTTSNLAVDAEGVSTIVNSDRTAIVSLLKGEQLTSGTAAGTRIFWGPGTEGVINSPVWENLFEGLVDFLVQEANLSSPPEAVSDLTAVGGIGQVSLTWSTPEDMGSPITGYRIEYRKTGEIGWNSYNTVVAPLIVVQGLENATSYQFRVFAQNEVGLSEASNLASAITESINIFKHIALIVGNPGAIVGTDDETIGDKLGALGHTVDYLDDNSVSVSSLNQAYDLAIITETAHAGTIGSKLNDWDKPIATFERGLLDDWQMGVGQAEYAITTMNIEDSSTSLAGGYGTGDLNLTGIVAAAVGSQLASDVKAVAAVKTNNTHKSICYVLSGDNLLSGTASGTRIFWGLASEWIIDSPVWEDLFEGLVEFLVDQGGTSPPTSGPPSAVNTLQAFPQNTAVQLSWSPPAGSFDAYEIGYKLSSSSNWTGVAPQIAASILIPGLTNGSLYNFRVRASSTVYGFGPWDLVNATPQDPITTPTNPLYNISSTQAYVPAVPSVYVPGADMDIHPNGREVHIFEVTNLDGRINNPIQGSFPWAVQEAAKAQYDSDVKYILFKVSGIIDLARNSAGQKINSGVKYFDIESLEKTVIAAQTAKGPVAIRGRTTRVKESKDVLFMHVSFFGQDDSQLGSSDSPDALQIGIFAERLGFKNCFMAHGIDENLDLANNNTDSEFFFVNCYSAACYHEARLAAGPHSKGALLDRRSGNNTVSLINDLTSHVHDRAKKSRCHTLLVNGGGFSTGVKGWDFARSKDNLFSRVAVKNYALFDGGPGTVIYDRWPDERHQPVYHDGGAFNSSNKIAVENIYYDRRTGSNVTDKDQVRTNLQATNANNVTTDIAAYLTQYSNIFTKTDINTLNNWTGANLMDRLLERCGAFAGHVKENPYQKSLKNDFGVYEINLPNFNANGDVPISFPKETGYRIPLPSGDIHNKNATGAGGDGRYTPFEIYLHFTTDPSPVL